MQTRQSIFGSRKIQQAHTTYHAKLPFENYKIDFVYQKDLYFRKKEWQALRKLSAIGHFVLHILAIWSCILIVNCHKRLMTSMKNKAPPEVIFYSLNDVDTDCAKLAVPKRDRHGIYVFHNVPYAARPISELRFRKPVYTQIFEECYGAFWNARSSSQRTYVQGHIRFHSIPRDDVMCFQQRYQHQMEGSENCLTLTIATPKVVLSEKKKDLLPVVVYVGGQSLMEGKPVLPSKKIIKMLNIVYVTVNYRLGVLGFLDFRDEPFVGNQGVLDVLMALEWIQTHIESFGGDKNQVTFYGDRAGGTIGLSLLNRKKNERFFHKLWLFRASVLVPEAPKYPFVAEDIMKATPQKCHKKNHVSSKVECLENVNSQFIFQRTPLSWRKIDGYYCSLPIKHERKISLILPRFKVVDPVALITESGYLGEIDALPLVLVSSLNDIPDRLLKSIRFGNMTKRNLEDEIKSKLSTFQTAGSTVNIAKQIINIAKDVIQDVEETSKMLNRYNDVEEYVGFEEIINNLISNIRSAIPNNFFTKYIKVNSHLLSGMYRILDTSTYGHEATYDSTGRACDVPTFLTDENHSCKLKKGITERYFGESCEYYRKAYLRTFSDFVHGKTNKTELKEAEYPLTPTDPALTETFNFLANAGFAPQPDIKTTFLLATGDNWSIRGDERVMIEQTGSVN